MNLIDYYKKAINIDTGDKKTKMELTISHYSKAIEKNEERYTPIDELMLNGTNRNAVFNKKNVRKTMK